MEYIITQILTGFKMQDTSGKIAKFREFVNKSFWFLVCVISILIAFFAGRTTKFMENRPAFYFQSKEEEVKYIDKNFEVEKQKLFQTSNISSTNSAASQKTIVASKSGKKYYFVWCKGAENIKEKNKRYFADEATAQKAGLTLAAACK